MVEKAGGVFHATRHGRVAWGTSRSGVSLTDGASSCPVLAQSLERKRVGSGVVDVALVVVTLTAYPSSVTSTVTDSSVAS